MTMANLKQAETIEGPEAATRFTSGMKRILSVSKEEMQRREAAYQAANALRPKRGPKPKASASPAPPA